MGFFDDAARLPEPRPRGTPWDPPADELPCAAATGALLLARTEPVAVAVTAIWAYKAGFEFWVKAQFRRAGPALESFPDDQSLHIGVQFADGNKAANVGRLPESAGSVSAGLILNPLSFGGGRRHVDRSYWVWPLPPAGSVAFVCEFAAFDIPEARVGTDAQLILDAAKHSLRIWPADHG
jgi:hypothetical protein